jgi:hypothetical protein
LAIYNVKWTFLTNILLFIRWGRYTCYNPLRAGLPQSHKIALLTKKADTDGSWELSPITEQHITNDFLKAGLNPSFLLWLYPITTKGTLFSALYLFPHMHADNPI